MGRARGGKALYPVIVKSYIENSAKAALAALKRRSRRSSMICGTVVEERAYVEYKCCIAYFELDEHYGCLELFEHGGIYVAVRKDATIDELADFVMRCWADGVCDANMKRAAYVVKDAVKLGCANDDLCKTVSGLLQQVMVLRELLRL